MARPLRIARAGGWYHITARGIDRRRIYNDDRDRGRWVESLAEAAATYPWNVHGYVLMENHYHLIIETAETNLSRAMQWLQTSYSMDGERGHPTIRARHGRRAVDSQDLREAEADIIEY